MISRLDDNSLRVLAQERLNVIAEALAALMASVAKDQLVSSKAIERRGPGTSFCCSATGCRIATATTRPAG